MAALVPTRPRSPRSRPAADAPGEDERKDFETRLLHKAKAPSAASDGANMSSARPRLVAHSTSPATRPSGSTSGWQRIERQACGPAGRNAVSYSSPLPSVTLTVRLSSRLDRSHWQRSYCPEFRDLPRRERPGASWASRHSLPAVGSSPNNIVSSQPVSAAAASAIRRSRASLSVAALSEA